MAVSGKGYALTGTLIAGRRRRSDSSLVKQRPGDAGPLIAADLLFEPVTSGAYTITAQGGAYTVTGGTAVIEKDRRLTASGGSYAVTGQQAVVERDRRLTAQGGAYALVGQQANITYTPAAVNYLLTAQGGSYALTGQAATLSKNRRLTASGGAYALTGQQSTIERDRRLTASGGAYSVTGQQATIERDRNLTAQGGTYAFVGQNATVTYTPVAGAYVLTAQGGSYSLSGGSASIQVSSEGQADTHDGYFHKLWRKLKEKPEESTIEAIAERIEAIEDEIIAVSSLSLPEKPIYIQSAPIPPIEAQAQLLQALIMEAARLRQELQDEEDAETLLLL